MTLFHTYTSRSLSFITTLCYSSVHFFPVLVKGLYQTESYSLHVMSGADPETLLTGGLSYGAIFSIIDGTNCSPKAVLAWSPQSSPLNPPLNAVNTHLNHRRIFLFSTPCGVGSLLCMRNINCKPHWLAICCLSRIFYFFLDRQFRS